MTDTHTHTHTRRALEDCRKTLPSGESNRPDKDLLSAIKSKVRARTRWGAKNQESPGAFMRTGKQERLQKRDPNGED